MPGFRPNQPYTRNENRGNEATVLLYHNMLSKKHEEISRIIAENIQRHSNWNKGWIDATWKSISPSIDCNITTSFRTSCCGRFIVPPKATHLESRVLSAFEKYSDLKSRHDGTLVEAHSDAKSSRNTLSMQRRRGRGGRFLLDRRHSSVNAIPKASRTYEPSQFRWRNKDQCGRETDVEFRDNGIYNPSLYEDSAIRYRVMIRTSTHRDNNMQTALSSSTRS